MEVWKDIEGFEGFYQVSNYGEVKSLDRVNSMGHSLKGRVLKLVTNGVGYLQVILCKNGKRKSCSVHRLVALAFKPNPKNLPQIDHIDGDKKNNHVENLRWVSHRQNLIAFCTPHGNIPIRGISERKGKSFSVSVSVNGKLIQKSFSFAKKRTKNEALQLAIAWRQQKAEKYGYDA